MVSGVLRTCYLRCPPQIRLRLAVAEEQTLGALPRAGQKPAHASDSRGKMLSNRRRGAGATAAVTERPVTELCGNRPVYSHRTAGHVGRSKIWEGDTCLIQGGTVPGGNACAWRAARGQGAAWSQPQRGGKLWSWLCSEPPRRPRALARAPTPWLRASAAGAQRAEGLP